MFSCKRSCVLVGLLGCFFTSMVAMSAVPAKHCSSFSAEVKGGYAKVNETVGGDHDNKGMMRGAALDYYLDCDTGIELGADRFPKVKYTGGAIKGNDAIHLAAVGVLSTPKVGLRGKLGFAQTRADVPSGLTISQGEHKALAWYVSFGLEGPVSRHVAWLLDASLVTKRKDVAAKYGLAAGLRFGD